MRYIQLLLLTTLFGLPLCSHAQQTNNFAGMQAAIDNIHIKLPQEAIYLQCDKDTYLPGDTLWFKAWLFNQSYLTPSAQSGIMYIDIAGDYNRVKKQVRLQLINGVTWGNIALGKEVFSTGNYTLRAYTSWLRNFGDEHFFYRHFTIAGATTGNLLVNTRTSLFDVNGNDSVSASLQFTGLDKQPLANKPLSLTVATTKKILYKATINTNEKGSSNINFTLPGKPLQINLTAENKQSSQQASFPLLLTHPNNIDLQFMPEGGNLVAGIPAHIGFKAIGEDGRGATAKGIIVNSSNIRVATFATLHKGMGAVDFTPQPGETYYATVTAADGTVKTYNLPAVNKEGIALQVRPNASHDDSLDLLITATPEFAAIPGNLMLLAQAREVLCYGAYLNFNKGIAIKRTVAKSLFPSGIARFTILNIAGQPLSQRLVFIHSADSLSLNIAANKTTFAPRDSIGVSLSVTGNDGMPVTGNFLMSVNDDAQVTKNTVNDNIVTHLLLSSVLKGYVEEPGYYFSDDTTAQQALDNLLLTQGWAGYSWQQVLNPVTPVYKPELEFMVTGSVQNIFNKGLANTSIELMSLRPALAIDTTTNRDGNFTFTHFPALDTPVFFIQARNRRGRSFNVGITVNETQPPAFLPPLTPPQLPWYVNSDTALFAFTQTRREIDKKLFEGTTLAPVTVVAKKMVTGSQNLNGNGNADQVIDEVEMEKAGKKSLLTLLEEKVPGFKTGLWPPLAVTHDVRASKMDFLIRDKQVKLIFDGITVDAFFIDDDGDNGPRDKHYQYIKNYLEHYTAEDIKGIEIMYNTKYNAVYNSRYLFQEGTSPMAADPAAGIDFVYLEITTRGNNGPFYKPTPGRYLYKSTPFSWPATFYSPHYSVKDTSDHSVDYRSTIYWQPNIVTGADGKATVNFYAADKPTTYTITVEGTDFNGNVAIKTKKITIETQKK